MVGRTAQIDLLARVLNAANVRHAVIAHNIANVNTPNYHRLEVSFEDEVSRLHAGSGGPRVVEATDVTPRGDGNTVDMDVEMGLMTQNALLTAAATQVLAMKLSELRSAITGR